MPLLKPTFQPFFPDTDSPNARLCGTQYCYPVADGDIVRQQWRQTPCAGSLVVDPTFDEQTLGPDLITDGDFDPCPGAWTFGANWSCVGNAATYAGLSTTPTLSQTGLGMIAGNVYQVTADITIGSGSAVISLGSGAGAAATDSIYATGTYTFDFSYNSADDTIYFTPSSVGNVITVDNVSVKLVLYTDWIPNGSWVLTPADGDTPAMACNNATGTGKLINGTTDYVVNGDRYVATVMVSNYASGSVQLYIDDGTGAVSTNVQTSISANGLKTYYFDATQDGVIAFVPTNDFVGCLSLITIRRLRNDFIFNLINAAGDSLDVSIGATYVDDKILLNLDLASLRESGDIDYGCFTINVYDACLVSGDNILTDGDFGNQDYTDWERNMLPHQYNYTGTGVEFILEPLEGPDLVTNGDFSAGTAGWTGFGADWALVGTEAEHTPGNITPLSRSITLGALPPFPATLFTWWQITISNRTAGTLTVNIGGTNANAYSANDVITDTMQLLVTGAQTLTLTPSSTFDGRVSLIKVHQTTNAWNNYPQLAHIVTPELADGNYNVDYEITSNVLDGVTGVLVQLDYNNPSQLDLTTAVHSDTFNNYVATAQRLRLSGSFRVPAGYFKPGRIAIDDVSLYAVQPFEATFTSECLKFDEEFEGSVLLTAWCDQDAFELDFTGTNYLLQMRVNCRSYNADLDDESLLAKFGDGNSRLVYGQLEKFWQFLTDDMSESALTTLAAMIRCDHFTVGDAGEDAPEYDAVVQRFTPAWQEDGNSDLAPRILTLRKREGGMKFNRKT